MALFSAGLKLDRPLTFRDWSSTARLLLLAMPVTIGAVALLGAALLGLSAARRAPARRGARADRPGAGRRHRRRPAGRRGRARAELRPDRRGRAQRRAGRAVRPARHLRGRGGRRRLGLASGSPPTSSGPSAIGIAIGAGVGLLAAWSVKRLHSHDMLVATFDGFHAIADRARDLRARRARGRLRLPRRLRRRARVPPLRARPRARTRRSTRAPSGWRSCSSSR